MINNPKVSIILPSLNVGMYIHQCMDSVVNQTLKDIEIICVDAGSTDGTLETLREFEKQDNRIKVILSEKKSYGYQMNLGLKAATGEYIGIVETDDWVEPDMYEILWNAAAQNDADVVKSNYFWYYTEPKEENQPFENLKNCAYHTVFSPENDQEIFSTTPAIWSGIYKKEFLMDHKIWFQETPGASFQDASFHFMVFTVAEKVYLLDQCYLHYRKDNANSSVKSESKVFCVSDEMHYYERFLDRYPLKKEKLFKSYIAWKYEKYKWNFERLPAHLQWKFLSLFRNEYEEYRNKSLVTEQNLEKNIIDRINLMIDRPSFFFSEYGKKYAARPRSKDLPAEEIVHASNVDQPSVSIIIPGYNAEDYIARSMNSVLQQTCKNIEIVCVDDGSVDKTLDVMLDAARGDNRITVLHQVNKGLSAARNAGMRVAKGNYIMFLDADDALREDTVEILSREAIDRRTDVLYFDALSIYASEELELRNPFYRDAYTYDLELTDVISGQEYFIRAKEDRKYRVSACMALYDLAFLKSNHIAFIDGIYQEDNIFTFTCMMCAKRVWHTSEKLYQRYVHEDSIMIQKKSFLHMYGYLISAMEMMSYSLKIPYNQRLNQCIDGEILNLSTHAANAYKQIEDKESCKERLTAVENRFLHRFVLQYGGEYSEVNRIKNSKSYKLGYAITSPARKALNLIRCLKKNGVRYTIDKYRRGLLEKKYAKKG